MGRLPFKDRLLVCDMDGTLLNSTRKVSSENRAALKRFVEGGGLFTVATGRMAKSVIPYLEDLPVNVPAIVYNGAAIYDFRNDKVLWEISLPASASLVVKQVIERFPGIGVQFYHGDKAYFVRENSYTKAHVVRENLKPIVSEVDEIPQPWLKIILAWEPEKLRAVEEFLRGLAGPFRQVYSEPFFLELLDANASKGNALKILTRKLGLSKSSVIAMGDNLNDMELIREANIGIAVDNAHDLLKAAADFCCVHHDKNAVSEVIEWIEDGKIVC